MAGLGEIFGGFAQGVGDVLQMQGKANREAAMKRLEMEHQSQLRREEATMEHGFNIEQDDRRAGHQRDNTNLTYDRMGQNQAADDERGHKNRLVEIEAQGKEGRKTAGYADSLDSGKIKSFTTDENGEMVGLTDRGKPIKTGVKTGGLSAKDKELVEMIAPQFTKRVTTEGEDGEGRTQTVTVDSAALGQKLRQMGRDDLAKIFGKNYDGGAIPLKAITALRQNPSRRGEFDAKFGAGASDRYLKAGGQFGK